MEQRSSLKLWIVWGIGTVVVGVLLLLGLMTTRAGHHPVLAQVRSVFLPGKMTSGHHQIELACETCHSDPFGGRESLQKACVRCHGAALSEADDKHPLSKFTDPRNAELLAKLDARECVTCHVEHKPQITLAMGVTQPADVCAHCHLDIATERPSHKDMKFDTCNSSGCHKFHDNRALYEDFLVKHAGEQQAHGRRRMPTTNFLEVAEALPAYPSKQYPLNALSSERADAPPLKLDMASSANREAHDSWLASAHARAGVNCSGCHQPHQTAGSRWTDHPDQKVCASCHALQVDGFLAGKHGMRLKDDLAPMTPADGRLPFKREAEHRSLGCTSCHAAHRFDIQFAAVRACLQCHDDEHSKQFEKSPHAELWRQDLAKNTATTGVTCASCHMPRVAHNYAEYDVRQIYVEHNQNDTLQPREKMIRPVCMNCHGLPFSIDALADQELVRRNFSGLPAGHVRSIDMAQARLLESTRAREADKGGKSGAKARR